MGRLEFASLYRYSRHVSRNRHPILHIRPTIRARTARRTGSAPIENREIAPKRPTPPQKTQNKIPNSHQNRRASRPGNWRVSTNLGAFPTHAHRVNKSAKNTISNQKIHTRAENLAVFGPKIKAEIPNAETTQKRRIFSAKYARKLHPKPRFRAR